DRDAAAFGDECTDLRIPHRPVERKRVQKYDRQSGADVVERDLGIVDEGDHSASGQCGSMSRQGSGTGTGWPCWLIATKTIEASATSVLLPTLRTSCLMM